MMSNMDILAFLVSAIISIVIVVWIASSNNKIGNYGVGENDPPTTKSPGVPGTRKISYNNVDFNELGITIKEDKKEIKTICTCGCKNVDIMSVVKRKVEVDEAEFNVVDIIYICTDCGYMTTKTEFLYER